MGGPDYAETRALLLVLNAIAQSDEITEPDYREVREFLRGEALGSAVALRDLLEAVSELRILTLEALNESIIAGLPRGAMRG